MKINENIKGNLEINPNGSGWLITNSGEKLYIYKKNTGCGLDRDVVEVKVIEGKTEGILEGKVVNIITRNKTQFTGIVQKNEDYGFLIIDSKRIPTDFYLNRRQIQKYKQGEKLLVELGIWKRGSKPECKVIRSLGMLGDNDAEMDSIIYQYNLNPDFPKEVEDESEFIDWTITDEEISKRKDFRDVMTVAIDPIGCKDRDDALSYRKMDNGNIEVGIHIADVSFYIKRDSEIDKEAFNRSQSIYLVDRTIPMIPEKISNGICSLDKNIDKLTYSFIFKFDKNFNLVKRWFGRGIVNLNETLSYEEAQKRIDNDQDSDNCIPSLNEIAKILRNKRNSLNFNKNEVNFVLDNNFHPVGINIKTSLESHKLIEEFMLLTNSEVGKFLHKNKVPNIYRSHDNPDIIKLQELKDFVNNFGYKLDINYNIRESLKLLLEQIKDSDVENVISELIVRTMSKAYCSVDNIQHYGLNMEKYSWVTSPIRRYSDILIHRQLTSIIEYGSYIR